MQDRAAGYDRSVIPFPLLSPCPRRAAASRPGTGLSP